jgi:Histidine kinase-, DNA gyrase B-, and HSP90-like ATPase/Nitrate and nitrite sensing
VSSRRSESGPSTSLRTRFLVLALVPSLVLVLGGIGLGGYLIATAGRQQELAIQVEKTVDGLAIFLPALFQERRLSVQAAAGAPSPEVDVLAQRRAMDAATATLSQDIAELIPLAASGVHDELNDVQQALAELPSARSRADAGGLNAFQTYELYNRQINAVTEAFNAVEVMDLDADVFAEFNAAAAVLLADEAVDAAVLLAETAPPAGLELAAYREYAAQSALYRHELDQAALILPAPFRDRLAAMLNSAQWRLLTSTTDELIGRGPAGASPADAAPIALSEQYRTAAADIDATTTALFADAARYAAADGVEVTRSAFFRTLIAAVAALSVGAVGAVVVIIAARMSGQLARRLERLRTDTLTVVEKQMPEVINRLRSGEAVPSDIELARLEHGSDEIGQVAGAFNVAQRTAFDAAIEEARTRAGFRTVFLNITNRSQSIVHRQLQLLNDAERAERDPDQLARLFQLDHLATRERRNAENLVILGGLQPRRRWRRPVALGDIVRSAISETEHYTRIEVGELPSFFVQGSAVSDLVHLLAELVDNASSFSPPESQIDVKLAVVGQGAVVEIIDRGLGIAVEDREQLNEVLASPPNFGAMTLTEDSRVGLFVVATLAARHGIKVRLAESTWSGIQAVVVIPKSVLTDRPADGVEGTPGEQDPLDELAVPARPGRDPAHRKAAQNGRTNGVAGHSEHPAPVNGTITDDSRRAAATPEQESPRPRRDRPEPAPAVHADTDALASDGSLPPLPERSPQTHLAAGLRDAQPAGLGDDADAGAPGERTRTTMSALQRGAREGRTATELEQGEEPT